jgi:hypothetical protein
MHKPETVFHCGDKTGDLTVRLPGRYDVVVLIKEGAEITIDGAVWDDLLDKCLALRTAGQTRPGPRTNATAD